MSTFLELSERRKFLECKREVFELVKDQVGGIAADQIILDDVLLDLDEKCVAPLLEEIDSIENSNLTAEKKDVKTKKERKPTKKATNKRAPAKKGATKQRGAKTNNARKRTC